MNRRRLFACAALLLGAPLLAQAARAGDLEALLAAGNRSKEDRARDAGRRPARVIAFLGIRPGDRVIDLIAAGGYYTEVLSLAVGEEGKVYAHNPPRVLRFRDGAADRAMTARLAGDRLPNVQRVDVELEDAPIEPGSLDAAITALNFHDVYNGQGKDAAVAFLLSVHRLLKPGGVLGLIDHAGKAGADNAALHRIQEKRVKEAIRATPFVIDGSSDMLRNLDDDHDKPVFDPSIRGHTDRFLLRLRKSG